MPNDRVPVLAVHGLGRRYPGVVAMHGVNLEIHAGEVIGLIGKNGAGKSTLIRLLSGIERPDEGEILIDGQPVRDGYNPAAAHRFGLAFMHQELANVPRMSVAENVALGSAVPRRWGLFIDWQALERATGQVLAELELDISPRTNVADLSPVQQRLVMIARALYHRARLLVLDEPSTSLTDSEIEHLHRIVRRMRADGRSVIYISHRLAEIRAITDRVIVMQDGRVSATARTADLTEADMVAAIAGTAPEPPPSAGHRPVAGTAGLAAQPVLRARGLTRWPHVRDVALDLHAGEILGIAGLVGAGRTELARLLAGVDRAEAGTIEINGRSHRFRSPRQAIEAGVVLLPEDRRHQGLVLDMSVRENVTLASLRDYATPFLRLLNTRRERNATQRFVEALSIRTPHTDQPVRLLSGGNQQKVVLAKWLARPNPVLIFDEPTQGVDIHARAEMFDLIKATVAQGRAAILISSDFSELVSLCDRVVIMREGRLVGSLTRPEITESRIVALTYAHNAG